MFEIYLNDTVVGSADVKRVGLYYHISCTCRPPSDEMCRILMRDGRIEKDLGICVPTAEGYTIFTRIPVKYYQGEHFTFELVSGTKGEYIISNNMPFPRLDKLEAARVLKTNGQLRIVINSAQDRQDSGQSPEYQNK